MAVISYKHNPTNVRKHQQTMLTPSLQALTSVTQSCGYVYFMHITGSTQHSEAHSNYAFASVHSDHRLSGATA